MFGNSLGIGELKKTNIMKTYKVVSLFAGCGGLDFGFTQAGFQTVWANEYDKTIWETYEHNHKGVPLDRRSIVDVPSSEIPDADGIIGGPPCQSWSLAGAMRGSKDPRGQLFWEYVRILREPVISSFPQYRIQFDRVDLSELAKHRSHGYTPICTTLNQHLQTISFSEAAYPAEFDDMRRWYRRAGKAIANHSTQTPPL